MATTQKGKKRAPRAKKTAATQNPLYCSFCGKTQHEVLKLIAGPTVFICDECIDLCVDIVEKADDRSISVGGGRKEFVAQISFEPALSSLEIEVLPGLVRTLSAAFPGYEISLRKFSPIMSSVTLTVVVPEEANVRGLQAELATLASKLRVAQQKLLAEQDAKEALERRVRDYETLIASRCIDDLKQRGDWPSHSKRAMLFCFVDVVNFSTLAEEVRGRTIDLLRNVVGMLTRTQQAEFVNMWGDGIVACFEDPKLGLECACLFVRHLEVYGLNVRVGVSWGIASIRPNAAVAREDVDGHCVNVGARLETLARPGEVLCSEDVAHLDGISSELFSFHEVRRVLTKAVGAMAEGESLNALSVSLKRNAASLLERQEPVTTPIGDAKSLEVDK